MNPPSAVLGGGVHGKVCWFIAYKSVHCKQSKGNVKDNKQSSSLIL